jgi:magnesium-transporting ATPase (P-type)
VYDNLRKSILFLLPTNWAEALTIVVAIGVRDLLPITPIQILWVNMVTAVTLALALAFEPAEANVMSRAPRSPSEPSVSRLIAWRTAFVSLAILGGTFGIFEWHYGSEEQLLTARTAAVNTLVACEIFYLFNTRHIAESCFSLEGLFGSRVALISIAVVTVLSLLFTYVPLMQEVFGTTAISATIWGEILLIGMALFLLVEAEKAWLRGRARRSFDRELGPRSARTKVTSS